ncbi:hypothetical protein OG728_39670 (plasmid) [Streptomyces microflavus]|uniref:hypothetical protein n=1 Tax=Streptomyces microflavus TaxID=1919 RepID=UPI002E111CDF|nr:hypothetical protein OG728_38095 [Streptomyces microflavus]WSR96593.1 hypothetical protein OG728_39670 [Streptomyces microflavus]
MLNNEARETDVTDASGWHGVFRRGVRDANDLVEEVRTAVEHGMHDPVDSLEMVSAAEETTRAVVTALSSPWSLYTPQDAATAAAGLFVQLEHQADALQELGRAVGRIAGRGETVLPDQAGSGQPANLADALAALQSVSEQVRALVAHHAPGTVRALDAAPASAPIPADVHETVVAVAELLAMQHTGTVTLNRRHEDGAFEDPEDGFGCGCDITLHTPEEEYTFYRGDCAWSIVKDSDGRDLGDGSAIYDAHETLSVSLKTAHPQQLADSVLRIIADDQQEPADFTLGLGSVPTGGS